MLVIMTSRIPWPSIRPSLRAAIGQQPWQCSRRMDGSRCQRAWMSSWPFVSFGMFDTLIILCSTASGVSISSSDSRQIFTKYFGDTELRFSTSTAPSPSPSAWPTDLWALCQRKMPKRKHDRLRNFRVRESARKLNVCLRKCYKRNEQKLFGFAKCLQQGFQLFNTDHMFSWSCRPCLQEICWFRQSASALSSTNVSLLAGVLLQR